MDDKPFAGRAALVTGGSSKIGKAIALRLGALGADVAVHYKDSEATARDVCKQVRAKGAKAAAIAADLADPEACRTLMEDAKKSLGRELDFLVNNAGTYPAAKLADLQWAGLSKTLRLNAWAPLELTRAFHRQVGKRGGAVVNLLDARIADFDLGHAGYFLAKRMLADLTRLCAVEFAPHLRVNGVAPGPVIPASGGDPAELKRLAQHTPLLRVAGLDDVADAVLYLLGARAVTGEVISVDGGRHLGKAVYG